MYNNFTQGCRPNPNPQQGFCQELPGTILRISLPPGATIRLGFIEVTSPSGICLIVRLRTSLLGGTAGLSNILTSLKQAGANVEILNN
ncbi:hypothetical protein GOM49_17965 [Clostridium bovifaecis]|uniref:Uncharacterized protein n=1 Tax=Clostridium bovifaecis TaxID=2184719 RepID=A0A6I6F2D4_9CLOT|nr:hypothetical protein GOM49_17965 [Clostridium bovifaecis]